MSIDKLIVKKLIILNDIDIQPLFNMLDLLKRVNSVENPTGFEEGAAFKFFEITMK